MTLCLSLAGSHNLPGSSLSLLFSASVFLGLSFCLLQSLCLPASIYRKSTFSKDPVATPLAPTVDTGFPVAALPS